MLSSRFWFLYWVVFNPYYLQSVRYHYKNTLHDRSFNTGNAKQLQRNYL